MGESLEVRSDQAGVGHYGIFYQYNRLAPSAPFRDRRDAAFGRTTGRGAQARYAKAPPDHGRGTGTGAGGRWSGGMAVGATFAGDV